MLSTKEIDVITKTKENKPFIVKGVFKDVLNSEEFEKLINLNPFCSVSRFITTQPEKVEYKWPIPFWGTNNCWPTSIIQKFIDNHVCYITNASKSSKKINEICKKLEEIHSKPVDAHLYFSKSSKAINGFKIHKDERANLIIQSEGSTHWIVGTKSYKDSKTNIENFLENDIISVNEKLLPGDVIYIPSHVYHYPKSNTKRISVSFPIAEIEKPVDKRLYEDRNWIKW